MQGITVYRAGLRAEERMSIERGLKDGLIDGVFSTNALELGIDIGGLDAVIIAGYPGSQMGVWQQAGRAGRGDKDAAVFLITSQNPIDQYFVANPNDLFKRQAESAFINVENENIARQHLICMAQELPFNRLELEKYHPASTTLLVKRLIAEGMLGLRKDGVCFYPREENPHARLSLRTSTTRKFKIINTNNGHEIGLTELPRLYSETHPGAIYNHAGETYRVERIDETTSQVLVLPINTNHATSSVGRVDIRPEKNQESRSLKLSSGLPVEIGKGAGEVVEQIYGYREEALFQRSRRIPDVINLDRPLSVQMRTEMIWLVLPPRDRFATQASFDSGLHGLEHLLLGLFPLEVMCDPTDIGSKSFGAYILNESRPTIFFFDSCEGGAGFAHGCYDRIEDLLQLAYRTIKSCRCTSGCPACVQSARCRDAGAPTSKEGARLILQKLLGS